MGQRLPTEIIARCFAFADSADAASCAAICASGTLGRDVCTPILYRTVGIPEDKLSIEEHSRRLQLQCRTLLENQKLAGLARDAKHYLDTDIGSPQNAVITIDRDVFSRILCKQTEHIGGKIEEILESAQRNPVTEEACIVLTLLLCPNLQSLDFTGNVRALKEMDLLIDTISCAETFAQPGEVFPIITDIRLPSSSSGDEMATVECVSFLLPLPGLRTLSVDMLDTDLCARLDSLEVYPNIEELDIQFCFAKAEELEYLVRLCPGLKSLSIEWAMEVDAHQRFDWEDLGDALRENCKDLERLRLDYTPRPIRKREVFDPWDDTDSGFDQLQDYNGRLQPLGSLKELESLTHLTITRNSLLGKDDLYDSNNALKSLDKVLPDSLQELTIICSERYILGPRSKALLNDPRVATLRDFIVMDSTKTHWISKRDGEGARNP